MALRCHVSVPIVRVKNPCNNPVPAMDRYAIEKAPSTS